jgi:hypothetical protein
MRATAAAIVVVVSVLALAGCGRHGLNDVALPGTEGSGRGVYEVRVEMANVGNLVPIRCSRSCLGCAYLPAPIPLVVRVCYSRVQSVCNPPAALWAAISPTTGEPTWPSTTTN